MEDKREYTEPKLEEWGSVVDVTEVGQTTPGNDRDWGSVNPPGHNR